MPEPAALARGWLAAVAVAAAAVLLFSASRYDYFGDELYFLAAGRHPSFGYADQGPVLPMLARLMDTVAPGSFFVLRLPVVLLTVLAVVLTADLAREFGGGAIPQLLAATAYATSPLLLLQGKLLTTNAVDTVLWVLITWLVVRWVRTRRDRLLFAAALVTAVDMQVKWLVPFLWLAIGIGALVFGPRELLRRPALWAGAAVVVAATAPSLLWQFRHDWPQLEMGKVIGGEQGVLGGWLTFVPLTALTAGYLGAALLAFGVWALLRDPALRAYRFLGPALPLLMVVFLLVGGRIYYAAGVFAVVMAAGAVLAVRVGQRVLVVVGALVTTAAVCFVLYATPWRSPDRIAPPSSPAEAAIDIGVYGEFGWPELTSEVLRVYDELPQQNTIVLTDTYWQASALDQFARERLPAIYSPSRGYGYFGTPPDDADTVLAVAVNESFLRWDFDRVERVGKVDSRLGYPGNTQDVTIWRCGGLRHPWAEVWPAWMHL
ncbi:glycosyl transferase family 39 [Nocardia panacis]|uniref:Glycosyl transferase family 39 n=1 Tax=Nocardia panacis TaxID=2340916 RepID=A0A3A4JRA8_9NOCA|nr:glycosyltransferase family 39 protein [Nocardia panacis]RJO68181.1 glycosyl transferase family 39 [Nocardia panacis]